MTNKLERTWKEVTWHDLRHYPEICLEGPRKTIKILSQDSRVSEPRFETRNMRILSRSGNYSTGTFGNVSQVAHIIVPSMKNS
jgi:hypothetical protein